MNYRTPPAPARPVSRALATATMLTKTVRGAALFSAVIAIGLGATFASTALAQPKPAAKKPAAAAPAQAPAEQSAQQQPVQLIYSPWTKFCLKNQNDPKAKQVCFTG
ncbi:MAG: invasion associated locus B family protein, partial [Xanthobacteraceae bacterium]